MRCLMAEVRKGKAVQTLMLSGSAGLSRDREAFCEAHLLIQSDACRQTSPLCQGQLLSTPLKPLFLNASQLGMTQAVEGSVWNPEDRMDSKNSAAGYAEYAVASEGFVMKIPDSLSFESAAAIPEVGAQDRKIALRGLLSPARALLQLPVPPCADAELRSAPSCLMQCPTLLLTECAWCRLLGLIRCLLKRLTLLLPTCLQTFITCYLEIIILGQLREGQSVLIHGAAGGIGAPALWLSPVGCLDCGCLSQHVLHPASSPRDCAALCCTLPLLHKTALHCAGLGSVFPAESARQSVAWQAAAAPAAVEACFLWAS